MSSGCYLSSQNWTANQFTEENYHAPSLFVGLGKIHYKVTMASNGFGVSGLALDEKSMYIYMYDIKYHITDLFSFHFPCDFKYTQVA